VKVVSGSSSEEFLYVCTKKSGAVGEHCLIPLRRFVFNGNLETVTISDYRMNIMSFYVFLLKTIPCRIKSEQDLCQNL
jgi:hypothetical protein